MSYTAVLNGAALFPFFDDTMWHLVVLHDMPWLFAQLVAAFTRPCRVSPVWAFIFTSSANIMASHLARTVMCSLVPVLVDVGDPVLSFCGRVYM